MIIMKKDKANYKAIEVYIDEILGGGPFRPYELLNTISGREKLFIYNNIVVPRRTVYYIINKLSEDKKLLKLNDRSYIRPKKYLIYIVKKGIRMENIQYKETFTKILLDEVDKALRTMRDENIRYFFNFLYIYFNNEMEELISEAFDKTIYMLNPNIIESDEKLIDNFMSIFLKTLGEKAISVFNNMFESDDFKIHLVNKFKQISRNENTRFFNYFIEMINKEIEDTKDKIILLKRLRKYTEKLAKKLGVKIKRKKNYR